MPPSKRRTSGPAARGSQSTLSFGSRARVTKPSIASQTKKKDPALFEKDGKPDVVEVTVPARDVKDQKKEEDEEGEGEDGEEEGEQEMTTTTAEQAIMKQAQREVEVATPKSKQEEEAEGVPETRIRKYWKGMEDERKAPRVHQQDLTLNEKILRHFDLSSQYGPCIGIARLKRWHRAQNLNLHPPIEVLAVLMKEEGRGNRKSERAYVDELMSSRFVIE
ncbi:MAG: hypothetical protein M1827_002511 [Pycnora praestabilis]|nr:MAG: hypothetical protein M1827_002511 [Pycnora praestabilis]